MKRKESIAMKLFKVLNGVFLIFIGVATLYPFLHVAAVSLSNPVNVVAGRVSFYPRGLDLSSYIGVFQNPDLLNSYKNTIVYTTIGTIVNVLMTGMTAYPLSKKYFFGRNFFMKLILFTMYFSGGLIPNYLLISGLGLKNSMWALIIPGAISTYNLILMRTFFQDIPESLEEAALIDGCTEIGVFFKIILPLSKPIISTMVLFYSVGHWNSFFNALLFLDDKVKYPLQIILRNIVISGEMAFANDTSEEVVVISDALKYATIMVSILPILLVYPFIQKYFVNVTLGSVKG